MFDRVRHLETRYAARGLGHFDTSQRIEPARVHLFEHIASHNLRSRVPPRQSRMGVQVCLMQPGKNRFKGRSRYVEIDNHGGFVQLITAEMRPDTPIVAMRLFQDTVR